MGEISSTEWKVQVLSSRFDSDSLGTLFYILCCGESSCSEDVMSDVELADSGPPPIGAQIAKLSPLIRDVITQFGFQEVGHLRAIKDTITGFPRLLLNLSRESFVTVMDDAFGHPLKPPFDAYANDINYLLASYVIPYVGLTGYVGANPKLQSSTAKRLVAGLLGVESGQDAVLTELHYERGRGKVEPYGITVAELTNRISKLRNKLGRHGIKDKGLNVNRKGQVLDGLRQNAEGNIRNTVWKWKRE
ncbi:Desiccation-related protein PCC13-62 [Capsicum annuum]|nr:Desiccation-related protein PCC13-62 [Capsicum annuum]